MASDLDKERARRAPAEAYRTKYRRMDEIFEDYHEKIGEPLVHFKTEGIVRPREELGHHLAGKVACGSEVARRATEQHHKVTCPECLKRIRHGFQVVGKALVPRRVRLEPRLRGAEETRTAGMWALELLSGERDAASRAGRRYRINRLRYKGDKTNLRIVRKSLSRTATKTLRTAVAGAHPHQLAQHPAGLAFAGAGVAAGAAPAHSSRGRKVKDTALGAVAGQVGYQGAGYAAEHQARHQVRWNARMSELPPGDAKHRVKLEQRARGRWRRAHEEAGDWHGGEPYRDFPLEHRRARTFRTLGYTHAGRTGDLLGATVTAAGAIAGYRHASRIHQSGPPAAVGKSASYGFQEKRIRPVRAAEFAAGATLLAYGGPRLQMAGPLIRTGATLVERYGGAAAAANAVAAAEKARGALLTATTPLEQLRRINRVNHAVEVVPRHLRPAVATTVGALLMARAHPVRQPVFVPLGGN